MFNIQVRIMGGLTQSQQAVFRTAAQFWSTIITADVPGMIVEGERVDDLLIEASGTLIDGELGVLGQAGPTHIRPRSLIPIKGVMEFDRADLARMEAEGSLASVIVHEMGHVLGIGTLWSHKGLLRGSGTANPVFTGPKAMQEFGALLGTGRSTPVPVENTGGDGTREGHWRDRVFGNELMTGFINDGENPLSRMTAASLEDFGYRVDLGAAEDFELPSFRALAVMGLFAEDNPQICCACGFRRRGMEPIIMSEDDIADDQREEPARQSRTRGGAAPRRASKGDERVTSREWIKRAVDRELNAVRRPNPPLPLPISDKARIEDELDIDRCQKAMLATAYNQIVTRGQGEREVSVAEARKCKTVGDAVRLVLAAIAGK